MLSFYDLNEHEGMSGSASSYVPFDLFIYVSYNTSASHYSFLRHLSVHTIDYGYNYYLKKAVQKVTISLNQLK